MANEKINRENLADEVLNFEVIAKVTFKFWIYDNIEILKKLAKDFDAGMIFKGAHTVEFHFEDPQDYRNFIIQMGW